VLLDAPLPEHASGSKLSSSAAEIRGDDAPVISWRFVGSRFPRSHSLHCAIGRASWFFASVFIDDIRTIDAGSLRCSGRLARFQKLSGPSAEPGVDLP
jgi:hypothetical protein